MARPRPMIIWKPERSSLPLDSVIGRERGSIVIVDADPEHFEAVSYCRSTLYLHAREWDFDEKGHLPSLKLTHIQNLVFRSPSGEMKQLDIPHFIENALKLLSGGSRSPVPVSKYLESLSAELNSLVNTGSDSAVLHHDHAVGRGDQFERAHFVKDPAKLEKYGPLVEESSIRWIFEGSEKNDRMLVSSGEALFARGGNDYIKLKVPMGDSWSSDTYTFIDGGKGFDAVSLGTVSGTLRVSRSHNGLHLRTNDGLGTHEYDLRDVEYIQAKTASGQTYGLFDNTVVKHDIYDFTENGFIPFQAVYVA